MAIPQRTKVYPVAFAFQLTSEMKQWIEDWADRNGLTQADVVREAMDHFIANREDDGRDG